MSGVLEAIWKKRAHRGPMDRVQGAELVAGQGVAGSVGRSRRRQVSLIDADVWEEVMAQLGGTLDPSARRANLLVRGVRLTGTRGRILRIGDTRIVIGGELTPCERMDEAFPGLQRALVPEWRGGVFAQVVEGGVITVGDAVRWEEEPLTLFTSAAAREEGDA